MVEVITSQVVLSGTLYWGRGRDPGSLTHSLSHSVTLSQKNAGAGAVHCQFMFQTVHATSNNGSSLEFVAATVARECNIQDGKGQRAVIPSQRRSQ